MSCDVRRTIKGDVTRSCPNTSDSYKVEDGLAWSPIEMIFVEGRPSAPRYIYISASNHIETTVPAGSCV